MLSAARLSYQLYYLITAIPHRTPSAQVIDDLMQPVESLVERDQLVSHAISSILVVDFIDGTGQTFWILVRQALIIEQEQPCMIVVVG